MPNEDAPTTRFTAPMLGGLTDEQIQRYETAMHALGILVARYSSLIGHMADPAERARLCSERAVYAKQQGRLNPAELDELERIICEAKERFRSLS